MTRGVIEPDTLVVIATGTEARFFRTLGTGDTFDLKADGRLEPQNLLDDGPAGKRPPESSQQETDEATFAKQLAHRLYAMAHQGSFEALVLAADPETLGQIRPLLHKEVQHRLVRTIDKTLTHHTSEEIAKILTAE